MEAGNVESAKESAQSIRNQERQASLLTRLARTAMAGGDEGAEKLARSIGNLERQAAALTALAEMDAAPRTDAHRVGVPSGQLDDSAEGSGSSPASCVDGGR